MTMRPRRGLRLPCAARRRARAFGSLFALALVAGCGAAGSPASSGSATPAALSFVTVAVTPATANVAAGGVPLDFLATVTNGSSSGVTWEVDGIVGGNTAAGSISTSGHYLSPGTVPTPATVTITAVSVADPSRSAAATVTISAPAAAPPPATVTLSPASATAQAGIGLVVFTASVTNATASVLTWAVNGIAGGNASVGTISASGVYTAPFDLPASPAVQVTATLASDPAASAAATVALTPPVAVAVLPAGASVRAGHYTQAFLATVSNASSAAVTWSVNGIPGGSAAAGTITAWGLYAAPAAPPNPAVVTISAASATDPTRVAQVPVTVLPQASVSVSLSPASASVQAGLGSQAFTASVSNSSSTAVTWQVNGVPGGTASVGTISAAGLYQAPANQPSPPAVTVSAVLVADPTRSGAAPVTVTPPVSVGVAPASATVTVATGTQAFAASVSYATASTVSWQVNGIPGGNTSVGTISAAGLYTAPATLPTPAIVSVRAVATADPSRSGTASLTLTTAAQVAVSVSPTLASVSAGGGTQGFTAKVTNGATGTVTWTVNGMTGGSASTGTVSATGLYTAPAVVPSPATVSLAAVSVDDPTKSATASVTVTPKSQAPTIAGTPQTNAWVGQPYVFQPSATSPGGAPLTFRIAKLPAWATFNAASGVLAGTPAATSIGSYANITISVSDGTTSVALPAFTITVNAGTTGAATLSWTAPTTRTDGSALTNLAGYHIYYGTTPGSYPNVITVANPGLTTYVVANLTAGTYYFVATAFDASGAESAYSNSGSKTIAE